jgi:hypothetical protein
MEELIQSLYEWIKRFSPFILVGTVGAVVHRIRNNMTLRQFLGSIFISVLVSLSVGVVCREYTALQDGAIYVFCGLSGTFSKLILDELEEILGDLSEYVRVKLKLKDKK